ncbi:hypothetical protein BDR05DRAFT_945447 [Suillus weaverae]|nr:hypothetical protein BDR05DRAFT_945447 [Suillus weaverae]
MVMSAAVLAGIVPAQNPTGMPCDQTGGYLREKYECGWVPGYNHDYAYLFFCSVDNTIKVVQNCNCVGCCNVVNGVVLALEEGVWGIEICCRGLKNVTSDLGLQLWATSLKISPEHGDQTSSSPPAVPAIFIDCFGSSRYIPSTIYTTASTMVTTQSQPVILNFPTNAHYVIQVSLLGPTDRDQGDQRHFGKIDRKTAVLQVEGNTYDEAFQESLKQQGLIIDLSHPSCQPIKGAVEEDMVMSSIDVKKGEISVTPHVEFQFQEGRRGVVLAMHKSQQEYIAQGRVLSIIHEAHQLKDKHIVSSTLPRLLSVIVQQVMLKARLSGRAYLLAEERPSIGGRMLRGRFSERRLTGLDSAVTPLSSTSSAGNIGSSERSVGQRWLDCPLPWDPLDEDGNEDTVYEDSD